MLEVKNLSKYFGIKKAVDNVSFKVEEGHIVVDRLMKTNIKGCFAAGDCVGKPYQYIKAAGEGNIASLSAVAYLNNI